MRTMVIAAAAGLMTTGLVCAVAVAEKPPEVTVEAGRIVKKPIRRTSSGIWINSLTLSYRVSYHDLNLAKADGAAELERRVKEAAQTACREIGVQYPDSQPNDAECARVTANEAMVTVREVVAAAQQAGGQ